VAENVRLGLGLISQAKRESAEQRLFDQFPALASRRGQVAGTLSGGEQQMLAMGRALVTDPRLLVIDELSLGLAPLIIDSIYESLRVAREQGVTILLVEQYIDRALAMADRVVLLQRGVVKWEGAAEEGRARLAGGYL
jgi:branched-chain amino acid transport system ATP-binding protein